jgi:hypothetical protein
MHSLNVAIIATMLVFLCATWAWVFIRVREIGVKVMKIELDRERFRLARKQFDANVRMAERQQVLGNIRQMGVPHRQRPDGDTH